MLGLIASVLVTGGAMVWTARGFVDESVRAHAAQPSPHAGAASAALVTETRQDVAKMRDAIERIDKAVSVIAATLGPLPMPPDAAERARARTPARPAAYETVGAKGQP